MDVSDADIAFAKSVDRQVFAENPVHQPVGMFGIVVRPGGIIRQRISINRLVGTAMHTQVGLGIATKTKRSDLYGAGDRAFDETARHGLRAERSDFAHLHRAQQRLC